MRLLLDEMLSSDIAEALRARGGDVHAVQDDTARHLRGLHDCLVLAHAVGQQRAVVTDNIPDFFRCHRQRVESGDHHFGLLLFTNDSFPRHRHELFVRHMVATLAHELDERPHDDNTTWISWLSRQR